MKRFIRYLYEYEQEKRIRNVGFVKVEAGDEEMLVHMQGKGFQDSEDRKLILYLFYEENGKIIGIRQAQMSFTTPMLSWHFKYAGENYSRINGVIIETASGRRIAATWDDRPVDVSRMVEMTEYAQEVDKSSRPGRKLTKIQRKDISRLPRCEWSLANDQFLIYGYNNYHHLVLIEEGNILKLGVPGIYHIEEANIAEKFGFGEFLSIEEIEISLSKEERHQNEPFGYWCRPVKKHGNHR